MQHIKRRLMGRYAIAATDDEIIQLQKQILSGEATYIGETHEDHDDGHIYCVYYGEKPVFAITRDSYIVTVITAGMVIENTGIPYHKIKKMI